MSNISDAYDALVTRLETILPSHNRLPNPYKPDENADEQLKLAWGVQVSTGNNSERNISCKLSIERSIIVVLTRRFFAPDLVEDRMEVPEKALLEDQFLVIDDFEKDPTLNDSTAICKMRYDSDSGIEYVKSDEDNFIKIESTFLIEYFEDLN